MNFKFLTWNIWFDNNSMLERVKRIMLIINNEKPDFVALQEVTPTSLEIIKKYKRKYHIIGTLSSAYDTIILSLHKEIEWNRYLLPKTTMDRNMLIANFNLNIDNRTYQLCIVTFHLESVFRDSDIHLKEEQLGFIGKIINPNFNIVIMGDTNFTQKSSNIKLPFYMTDCFDKAYQPEMYRITFNGQTNTNVRNKSHNSRLDRIYFNERKFNIDSFILIGTKKNVPSDNLNWINPSDHYGVLSVLKCT